MIDLKEVQTVCPELFENYRRLHQHPELGFEEFETSGFIMEKLKEYGIDACQISETGVLATITGEMSGPVPGKTIAIRADMDALPLTETADVPYRSEHNGVMHACGHDAHVTMLLGAAKFFASNRHLFSGSVRLIFQPAEEGMRPERLEEIVRLGGSARGGAASMIKHGALDGVDACFALHVFPHIPTGVLAVHSGRAMASSDIFNMDICGRGGHGSSPETAIDPVGALSGILAAFNAFPSRELSPFDTCVVSVGVINTDSAWNIIPDRIHVEGGVRTYDNRIREYIFERLPKIAQGICEANRCHCEFKRQQGYDPTVNSSVISQRMLRVANEIFGDGKGVLLDQPAMGSEDVGYYFQQVPGAIGCLGCKSEDMPGAAPHSPDFRIDPEALSFGVLFHINMVLDFLSEN